MMFMEVILKEFYIEKVYEEVFYYYLIYLMSRRKSDNPILFECI